MRRGGMAMGWLAGHLVELLPGRTVAGAHAFGDGGIGLVFADGACLYLARDGDFAASEPPDDPGVRLALGLISAEEAGRIEAGRRAERESHRREVERERDAIAWRAYELFEREYGGPQGPR